MPVLTSDGGAEREGRGGQTHVLRLSHSLEENVVAGGILAEDQAD